MLNIQFNLIIGGNTFFEHLLNSIWNQALIRGSEFAFYRNVDLIKCLFVKCSEYVVQVKLNQNSLTMCKYIIREIVSYIICKYVS